jgi:tRNA-dihydrouridine synthase
MQPENTTRPALSRRFSVAPMMDWTAFYFLRLKINSLYK